MLRNMKPQVSLKMRISINSSGEQRFTYDEIMFEFVNNNINIIQRLVIRKTDGAVMGEILI